MTRNIQRLLQNPDEVYEEIRDHDGAQVTVYVREMMLNGNKVVAFALVVNGEVITSFVPAGEAPPGSSYQDAYDREYAINYNINEVLSENMEKIEEFDEVIEEIDEGKTK